MKKKLPKLNMLGFLLPLLVLALWILAGTVFQVPAYIIPTPGRVASDIVNFVTGMMNPTPWSGQFMSHSITSIIRVGQGFLVALAIGFPLGLLTGRFNAMKQVFDPLFNMVRTIPGISWLPLAMVWFGIGSKPTVFLIAVGAFFPIYLNTAIGVKQIPDGLIQAARMLGARGRDLFFRTIIPAAAASILTGMRLGLGFAWAYLVVGEMTGVSQGLGATMMGARLVGNTSMIIVCMLCIAFWGVVTDRLLVYVIRKLHPSKEIMSHE